jgi:hypothetical protein
MTATQDIRRALEQRLNTGTYTGVTNSTDIAWENIAYDPANKDRWLRPRLIISEVIPATADSTATELWTGLFIVDAFTKQNDGGAAKADILADEIKARFPKGTQLTENGKTINIRFSQISGLIQDSPWAFKSVTMTFYSYI